MPSKTREIRLEQKAHIEARLNERLSVLKEAGVDPHAIPKDRAVRKLRADLRHVNERLSVIEKKEQKIQEMARTREEKRQEPKDKKDKKSKAEEDQAAMSKRQQKKLAKQQDKGKKQGQEAEA